MDESKKVKRVRRKKMNVETFARFCNRASEALFQVYAEFDPSHDEIGYMLERLYINTVHTKQTQQRRTS